MALSEEQLQELLRRKKGSFSQCWEKFNGEHDPVKVEAFIAKINVFKDVEYITDEEAIRGFPLLLEGNAVRWWQGVKEEAATWEDVLDLIRSAYAPAKPAYRIYLEIHESRQKEKETTDDFICKKRALIAQLPAPKPPEVMMLDFVYGLLSLPIREGVPRESFTTFRDLLVKARMVELNQEEKRQNRHQFTGNVNKTSDHRKKCNFCKHIGHSIDECRKKQRQDSENKKPACPPPPKSTVHCFGCKAPGFIRSNCPTCKDLPHGPSTVSFNYIKTTLKSDLPTIMIRSPYGETGVACIDTAARTSVASRELFIHLARNGTIFRKREANVTLADGSTQLQEVCLAETIIKFGNRLRPIKLLALPEAKDNRTLIGIDFLEENGIVLNLGQRYWYFLDQPCKTFDFYDTSKTKVIPSVSSTPPNKKQKKRSEFLEGTISLEERGIMRSQKIPTSENLGPVFTNRNPNVGNSGMDYSPHSIQSIFKDALPEGEKVTPDRGTVDLFPRPTARPNIDSYFTEILAIDVSLRETEGQDLSLSERTQMNGLLGEQRHLFGPLGEPTPHATHSIDTGKHEPIATTPYRLSPVRTSQLKDEIAEMIKTHIIEECESPWAAPVVLVPKKDGKIRVCVDYRKLNAITVPDKYPMPRIDDLLHATKPTIYKTTLDLQSGYYQIKLAEKDRDKSAFVTPFGMFRFTRMPFGLRNAPAAFQRLMDRFRVGLAEIFILVYLDDIIISSRSFKEHYKDLEKVFSRLNAFNLKINRLKSNFCCEKVRYLGHIITNEGIEIDPEKTSAIILRAEPRNIKQVMSFLQTCSWYRRFIPDFAGISNALSRLLKKNTKWTWGEAERKSFNLLKTLLTTAPILQQADIQQPFILKTDASGYALGAVLVQGEGDKEHPVEYASRLLSAAERNYSTIEREALAIVWAMDKFRGYIEGSEITLLTDHQPLKWLMSLRSPTGRLARWALQLQPYNCIIKYTPGSTNKVADTLSRPPCKNHKEDEAECVLCTFQVDLPTRGPKEIREAQQKDEYLNKIIQSFEKDDEDLTRWTSRGYLLSDGILYRYWPESDAENGQLVIPEHERVQVLKKYHDDATAGHYGIDRTIARIASRFYWPGMRKEIAKYIGNCIQCQRYKPTNLKPCGLLQTVSSNQRFEVVAIDLFGPLPITTDGFQWILIAEDLASRWVELFALKEATAENCAKTLLEEMFLRYGTPRRLLSDNGVQFISAIMQHLTYCLGIKQFLTPYYHPQANPVERKNRDLKTQLAILVENDHAAWADKLPAIRFAMNTAQCQSTGYSASFLTFGRELRTINDVAHDLKKIVLSENFLPQITPRLLKLAETLEDARETVEKTQDHNKTYVDKKRRPQVSFKPGDLVLVTSHVLSNAAKGVTSKFVPKRDGPYVIITQVGKTMYQIGNKDAPSIPLGTYHVSAITKFTRDVPSKERLPSPVRLLRKRGRPRKNN